jgi:hypothetical protein
LYMDPLSNFVEDLKKYAVDAKEVLEVSDIRPEIRTTLLLCSEKCVQAANIIGVHGKLSQLLWKELAKDCADGEPACEAQDFFVLPSTALVPVEETRSQRHALFKPKILQPIQSHLVQEEISNYGKRNKGSQQALAQFSASSHPIN